ncbi:hypothetical protein ACLOJK_014995 [Asimina triloba]
MDGLLKDCRWVMGFCLMTERGPSLIAVGPCCFYHWCALLRVGSNGFEGCLRQTPMLVDLSGSSIGAGGHDLLLPAAAQIWVDGGADRMVL